jgi:hypothetical protein
MYSKCIVSPLIRTPIAITASKGDVNVEPAVFSVDIDTSPDPSRSDEPTVD